MEEIDIEGDFQKVENEVRMAEYKAIKYENKYFTSTEYQALAKALEENSNKNTLIMISIHIDSEGLMELSKIMKNNFQIKYLQISWSNFNNLRTEFHDFCVALSTAANLYYLNLSNNNIDSTMAPSIQYLMETNKNLRYLDLSWNNFKQDGARAIIESFEKNQSQLIINMKGTGSQTSILKRASDRLLKREVYDRYKLSNIPDIEKFRYTPTSGKADQLTRISVLKILEEQKVVISKKDENIKELQKRIAELEAANAELENKLKIAQESNEELKVNFDKCLENEDQNRQICEEKIRELQQRLSEMTIQKNSLESEKDRMEEDLNAQIQNLKEELNLKKQEAERLRGILDSFSSSKEIAKLNKEITTLKRQHGDELLRLKDQNKIDLENKGKELSKNLDDANRDNLKLKNEIQRLNENISRMKINHLEEKEDQDKRNQELVAKITNELNQKFDLYQTSYETETKRLRAAKKPEVKEEAKEITIFPDGTQQLKDENQKLMLDNNDLKTKNAKLESGNSSLQSQIKIYKSQIQELDARADALEKELNSSNKLDKTAVDNKMRDYKNQIKQYQDDLQKMTDVITTKEKTIKDLNSQIDNLKRDKRNRLNQIKNSLLNFVDNN
ncbi:MAG: hypothetical protein MJ252_12655 [archaeon]|nr:hypothetical protein [archaeon]